ncbi:hypothetical protein O7599_13565 [Streptomyces sp. WMMC500]|uniref:hypothetical protein n=1 Tax=Streptomyces sp. WMMC500 TaxID=3015154 RepID=UPI00248B6345|nr:hypothetical protein [Streptomyces sp. WMMC500]WBB64798.1 hypothetical protein O7599_13565 [Streptomyces sp. WMMC500]
MNTSLAADLVPLAEELDKNKVTPGVLGFIVFALLGVAVWFLLKSMNRHLGQVDFKEKSDRDDAGPSGPRADGEGPGDGGGPRDDAPRGDAPRGSAPRGDAPGGGAPRGDGPRDGGPGDDGPRDESPRTPAPADSPEADRQPVGRRR